MSNAWVLTVMAERSLFQRKQRERAVEKKLLIREREAVLDLGPIFVFCLHYTNEHMQRL